MILETHKIFSNREKSQIRLNDPEKQDDLFSEQELWFFSVENEIFYPFEILLMVDSFDGVSPFKRKN